MMTIRDTSNNVLMPFFFYARCSRRAGNSRRQTAGNRLPAAPLLISLIRPHLMHGATLFSDVPHSFSNLFPARPKNATARARVPLLRTIATACSAKAAQPVCTGVR